MVCIRLVVGRYWKYVKTERIIDEYVFGFVKRRYLIV